MRVDFNFFRRTDDRHQNRLLNPASRMRARGNYAFHTIPVEFICYDDGCHFSKFAQNSTRKDATPTAQKLAKIEIVIDKLHMEGNTDKWCIANCNPQLFKALDKVSACHIRLSKRRVPYATMHLLCKHSSLQVDTEACEQCFSWLSRYARITRQMQRSTFFVLCTVHV